MGAGYATAAYLTPANWLSIATLILVWLSTLAAAVLFRLGRGLPPFQTEELKLETISRLTQATQDVARRLSVLFYFVVGTLVVHIATILIVNRRKTAIPLSMHSLAWIRLGRVHAMPGGDAGSGRCRPS